MSDYPHGGLPALKMLGGGPGFGAEMAAMLEGVPMLSELDGSALRTLAAYMQAYRADDGMEIFREAETGQFMCLLVDGRVEISKEDSGGRRKIVSVVTPGKALGEMSLIDGEPRSATAVAAGSATLLLLTREEFLRIQREHPRLAVQLTLKLARLISQRLRQTSGVLVDFLG
jgi:CRP/FNR family cyclic AMP-dependent transcriptional regulator